MKNHILFACASSLLALLVGCSTPATPPLPPKAPQTQSAQELQHPESGSLEYHMPSTDFVKRFGVMPSEMPHAPKARLAPVPPLPWKMMQAQRGGWIDFVVEVDHHARVAGVEVVGYSEENIVMPASADSIRKWWFFDGTKPGWYFLRATFTPVGPNQADVTFN